MRRNLILSVLGACLLMLALGSSAIAGGSTYYAGTNSQGQKLLFSVDHTASGPEFDPIFINQISRCPATGSVLTVQYGFSGFQIPITNGKFSFVLNDLSNRFSWSGTVTAKAASGQEYIDQAAFDNEGGLQECGAGVLPWTAKALAPASSKAVAPGASYHVRVTRSADGKVQFTVTH